MKHLFTLAVAIAALGAIAQTPCVDGEAGGYPCENVDLIAHYPISDIGGGVNLSDNWGWTDPESGREFAIIGRSDGTSFMEITDANNAVYLGNLPTHTTAILWRDMKVFDHYAFIVSEAGDHGMQVFDLEQLLNVENPPVEFEETAHYDGFGSAHNIAICEESGFAYGVGTTTAAGGLHIVDINDPLNPVIAGTFSEDGYTHDAQVVIYTGPDQEHVGDEVAFACNEDELTLVDCTDKSDCQMLGKTTYPGNVYAHQGWLTEDHRYFILDDEIDENSGVAPYTRTHVFDVQDLENPTYVGFYEAETTSSDHNLYTLGDLVIAGNYRSGVRILHIDDAASASLSEVGYFDTAPFESGPGYTGVWNCYPYFESGVLVACDMFNGLFLLAPDYDAIAALNVEENTVVNPTFNLSPNPAAGNAEIRFNGFHTATPLQVRAVNLAGQVFWETEIAPALQPVTTIPLADWAAGMYTIQVETYGTQRLIKQP